jgi:hypothetical protein
VPTAHNPAWSAADRRTPCQVIFFWFRKELAEGAQYVREHVRCTVGARQHSIAPPRSCTAQDSCLSEQKGDQGTDNSIQARPHKIGWRVSTSPRMPALSLMPRTGRPWSSSGEGNRAGSLSRPGQPISGDPIHRTVGAVADAAVFVSRGMALEHDGLEPRCLRVTLSEKVAHVSI